MRRRLFTAGAFAAAVGPAAPAPAMAQDWPNKPIRMVIPYPPGGPSDVSTRIVMDRAAQSLRAMVRLQYRALVQRYENIPWLKRTQRGVGRLLPAIAAVALAAALLATWGALGVSASARGSLGHTPTLVLILGST